jgi:hypothetical protein
MITAGGVRFSWLQGVAQKALPENRPKQNDIEAYVDVLAMETEIKEKLPCSWPHLCHQALI